MSDDFAHRLTDGTEEYGHPAEKEATVASLDQRRERRDESMPAPGEPAITFGLDDDRITFRDQAALDEYVAGACDEAWSLPRSEAWRLFSRAVPPTGWHPFGAHADQSVRLEFSGVLSEDGLPLWERVLPPGVGESDA